MSAHNVERQGASEDVAVASFTQVTAQPSATARSSGRVPVSRQ
ncbi:hypothetical protein FHY02_001389 [Sphingomonas sp. BK069]|nr:hypothetical protein [Sphingomonas sp. BK069]